MGMNLTHRARKAVGRGLKGLNVDDQAQVRLVIEVTDAMKLIEAEARTLAFGQAANTAGDFLEKRGDKLEGREARFDLVNAIYKCRPVRR